MRWDIFCKVIDNWGDIGVCWRLACELAARGDAVRLWADDSSALAWMAPAGCPGVSVVRWADAAAAASAARSAPDCLIEAFGCHPDPDLIANFAGRTRAAGRNAAWINLEYLSAEPHVEGLHGLPSPVFHGPGAGLVKHFYYPGFSASTGGLLREAELMQRHAAFDRGAWLARQRIDWRGERLIALFCYEPPALPALLEQLASSPQPVRLLVSAGRAARALPPGPAQRGALSIDWLPALPQTAFDELLWCCDLNFVRGEDSLARALWAGEPFVWQIYAQHDEAHHIKLEAFLDWLHAPPSMRAFHRVWNGMAIGPLPAIDAALLADWRAAVLAARARLLAQDDLVTRLRSFVVARRLK